MRSSLPAAVCVLMAIVVAVPAAPGQSVGRDSAAALEAPEIRAAVGSAADGRLRSAQLWGEAEPAGYLLRSTSSLWRGQDAASGGTPPWEIVPPQLESVWNSDLPYSLNDGGLWAGRGMSVRVRGGGRVRWGPAELTLLPEMSFQENRDFQTLPAEQVDRSRYASPWRFSSSIDAPHRYGDRSFARADWGESSLVIRGSGVVGGVATERQWWGPGARNALLLSANAPGFSHLFVSTDRPMETRVGKVEGKWLLGWLMESPYFDANPDNDRRSINGAVVTLAPAFEPELTVGAARVVYGTLGRPGRLPLRALDVLLVGNARTRVRDDGEVEGWDQLTSVFFRWVLPRNGFELYGELARMALPGSARDLLVAPNHSQGFTLGVQWVKELRQGVRLRVHPEFSYLEQSGDFTQAPIPVFYRSETVPQGFTHRGEVLGASIGPGSSQSVSVDLLGGRWEVGAFAGRIRWDNDAYYTSFVPRLHQIGFVSHDVTMLSGIRGYREFRWGAVEVEYTDAMRYDYLFQNRSLGFNTTDAVDVPNRTLRLSVTPHSLRRDARQKPLGGRSPSDSGR